MLLAAEAFVLLGIAWTALRLVAFRRIAPLVGTPGTESGDASSPESLDRARRIGWAVLAASRRTPWESVCLPRAIAASWMLRLRGIPCTLYLAVGRVAKSDDGLTAHAWVRCGPEIVADARGGAGLEIVGRFGRR